MANGVEREMVLLFSEEELREMSGVKSGGDYIEVMCGCTSHRYGDAVGLVYVYVLTLMDVTVFFLIKSDKDSVTCMVSFCDTRILLFLLYRIMCKFKVDYVKRSMGHVYANVRLCSVGYSVALVEECGTLSDKMTPAAFEKHSGRETARKWKNNVWVIVNGEKVPLAKTVLLKYYNQTSKKWQWIPQVTKWDEFVIAMSLCDVINVTRIAGSDYGPKRSVRFTMMLWLMRTGNVLICHMTKFSASFANRMKNLLGWSLMMEDGILFDFGDRRMLML
ncbi:PROTEIN ULTRAPETALA 1 [Salix koriyanagi]|uniref:PROTEIN ULTRAPETALA 1 n=1 Tax=Salix koriyanagi TaxID=2511006 RepID=A0A9Q0W0J1_9ROSI|nr:PROTEIN ULTRAPETALA 1 [Salix koriyanagi]